MKQRRTIGLVLAAGFSSRARTNKMLFNIDGKYLIQHSIDSIRDFVDDVFVVLGHNADIIKEALKDYKDINFIYNDHYEKGMYSSILCGLANTTGDVLLIPGDVGFVSKDTIKKIFEAEGNFIAPVYKGQPGHPILISHNLRQDILNHPDYPNMRTYRNEIGYTRVDVDDIFITLDCDSEEDLENIKQILKERKL